MGSQIMTLSILVIFTLAGIGLFLAKQRGWGLACSVVAVIALLWTVG
jgi:hypothetical protein